MSLTGWTNLNLLWHPAHARQTPGKRQRVRRLLDDVMALTLVPSTQTFWRGLSRASYRLTPSVLHSGNGAVLGSAAEIEDHGDRLVADAVSARHVWRDGVSLRGLLDLETLALLQHFRTRTPLLDLTADPLVSLYFAARAHDDEDGVLIGWNAVDWLELTNKPDSYKKVVQNLTTSRQLGWLIPPVVTDRVVVQRSRMLVAPVDPQADHWAKAVSDFLLPELPPDWNQAKLARLFSTTGAGRRAMPPALAIKVPKGLKPFIRDVLSHSFGIDGVTMFPDAAGYGQEHS